MKRFPGMPFTRTAQQFQVLVLVVSSTCLAMPMLWAGGSQWVQLGLGDQTVTVLAVDPHDQTTLYAGTGSDGGLFKTTSGGGNWTKVGSTERLAYRIAALVIDPEDPRTVYLGTSDGVLKSTDGGANWNRATSGLPTTITALVADPRDGSTLYAGSWGDGVFKTTDGGEKWIAAGSGLGRGFVYTLAIDPTDPSTLYAGTGDGLFRSRDGGKGWLVLESGMERTTAEAVAIDPENPTTLYVGVNSWAPGSDYRGRVFKSTDGGENWREAGTGLAESRIHALAIDPKDPSTLYCGTQGGVFRSGDGGTQWIEANSKLTSSGVNALALVGSSSLYAASLKGGVFKLELGR